MFKRKKIGLYKGTLFFLVMIIFSGSIFSKTNGNILVCDTAFAGNDKAVCGDTSSLTANTALNGTGSWSLFSGAGTITSSSSSATTLTGLGLGTNVFVWTITGGGCPTVSDTVSLTVDTVVTTSVLGLDTEICSSSVNLLGNTPTDGNGVWGLLSGTGTIASNTSPSTSVTNLAIGANVFRWKISNGACFSFDDITITRDANSFGALAGPDQTICNDSCFMGGNTPPYGSGVWTVIYGTATLAFPTNSGTIVSGLIPGDTTIYVWTMSNGVCPTNSDTAMVIYNAPPTTAFCGSDQTICSSTSILSANLPSSGTGVWTIISGSATITNTASQNSPVTAIAAGTNVFVWTISNGVCPASTDTMIIYNTGNPSTPNAGPNQEICSLASTFAATSPVVGTGAWSLLSGTGNIVSPTSPTSIVSNLSFGQNIFIWTTSNGICPSLSDSIIITVDFPSTNANAGPDFSACGPTTNLSGSSPVNGVGTWTVFSGTGNFSSPNSGSTSVSAMTTGANTFVWTIVNGVCPASSDTVIVTSLLATSAANAGPNQEICKDSTSLSANSPAVGTGAWSIITAGPTLSSLTNPNVTANNLIVGQNIFIWTITNGVCQNKNDSVIVTVDQTPTASNAGSDINSQTSLVTLNGNVPVIGTGIWNNLSNEGNILSPLSDSSSFLVSASGTFLLTWTITNGVCPASVDTISVKMDFVPIPEIITPNGDGQNDVFLIKALQFSSNIKLAVYNRWGGQVFLDENYQHNFDGRNNSGVELPEDTYFYQVQANGVEKFKGYLVIKRK